MSISGLDGTNGRLSYIGNMPVQYNAANRITYISKMAIQYSSRS